jgi:aryl-alcohol dehydrogenase-like predicted oxidoreductase
MVSRLQLREGRLGLGTAPLGSSESGPLWWGPQDRDVAVATVRAAAESGAAFIDTAPFYGWGRAEEIVRDGLAGVADRPPVFTKCATLRAADGTAYDDSSPAAIRADVERSRERLGMERIDVVQVHDPDPLVPIEETWGALMALRADGVIGGAGLSNHPTELMDRALTVGPVAVVQHQYSLLNRAPERDGVIDWCAENGVPFLAWAPLASGFLADDFDAQSLHPDDLRRGLRWATEDAERVRRVRTSASAVADRHGTTMVSIALAWASRTSGTHAILGARSPAEAEAFGTPLPRLDADDVDRLTSVP